MIKEGNTPCAEKLAAPAKRVIKSGFSMASEPFQKRVQLWNNIRKNREQYLDGACGNFLKNLDKHYRALFDVSLLVLARTFQVNKEDFPAADIFNDKEVEAYENLEQYNVFEIRSTQDIKKKVVAGDERLLQQLEEYYGYMDEWMDETLEDPEIRLTIRYYLKKRWDEYKQKLNTAITELINEYDWFRKLVHQWSEETSKAAETIEQGQEAYEKIAEREEELHEMVAEIISRNKMEDKEHRYVDMAEAKFYENNFIGRMKRKLQREITIGGVSFKVEALKESQPVDLSESISKGEENIDKLPANTSLRCTLTEKKLLGRKRKLTLKITYCSHVDRFVTYGFDTVPLDLEEINRYLSEAMETADESRMLLCLASPTGFTTEVRNHICGDEFHKNFLSAVSICLLDIETGEIITNPHDRLANLFQEFCRLETDRERLAQIRKCIEDLMAEQDYVTLEGSEKLCGPKKMVKQAFYELEEDRGWRVRYIKNVGLVLVRR